MQYRSKLARRPQNNKIVGYIILLVILVIFLATVGVRLLINFSIFVADNLSGQRSEKQVESNNLVKIPELVDYPSATNSATVEVTGSATENTQIKIFVNDEVQKDTLITEPTFTAELDLNPGENTIRIEALDQKTKKTLVSSSYTIIYSREKPNLEISSPTDGTRTDQQEIEVKGTASPGSNITVNNRPAITDSDGAFSYTVKLSQGENTIVVQAKNDAGSVEEKSIKVIKED